MNNKQIQYAFGHYDPISQYTMSAENVFTKEECEKIIEMGRDHFEKAEIAKENKEDISVRKSEIFFIDLTNDNRWLFERLEALVLDVNEKVYRFNLTGFYEGFQLTKYEKGGMYKEHMDAGCPTLLPRKLSLVIQLTDPSEYEGGNLGIKISGSDTVKANKKQGSVTVFPSFLLHEVEEVTKGTRYSLVSWVGGPQFR